MTNFEKYTDELCKILSHYVGVSDDKPRICNDLSCKNCDFDDYGLDCIQEAEDWLKGEAVERPMVDVPDINVGNSSEIPNNSDCVSRRAVIEKLKREFNETDVPDRYPGVFDAIEEWLSERELPSAQPEFAKDTNVTTNDLIDRQAAIDALIHKWDGMVTSVFDVLKELPSSQPEIILCKDCIHRWHSGGRSVAGKWIRIYRCKRHGIEINLNDFCSYAERKKDG